MMSTGNFNEFQSRHRPTEQDIRLRQHYRPTESHQWRHHTRM